ncbi:glyceraldehyde-3-phosphate dehydrogenase [Thalassococcus sp. CAU 1522]|uniref:Glyceraldehyde-3-phosphate dehydrogenase n=1 Tax=Thalassococcus arenae TaxID=2851652 RepID=A0ABS6N2U0_9RHOB|nr:glyceraldehyde 3-phosphate dehydrogenase NAD-binding domain-containing protein [Thalassococcus arenae]MBV2358347.1 glyceraldehyde-3-phosphate dehydrogenase [Thalassococcus arenae]
MRIAINGFGRIGRTVLRQVLTDPAHADIEVAAINDIAPPEICAYLLKYDSVYGPFPGSIALDGDGLSVAGRRIAMTTQPDLGQLRLAGVDVLMECTGKIDTRAQAERFRETGAARMLISGPSDGAEVTCVLGANEAAMGAARIVSNASCTTNALAPLLKALDAACGIERGHMTTVHVYTGSQPMVDAPRGDTLVRSRAGAVSMVPTTTSATRLIDAVLPALAGRITGAAVRVPAISVSAIDLTVTLARPPADMTAMLRRIAEGSPVIAAIDDACVSTDLRGRPESLILALPETLVSGPQVRIFGWYDNEWGFAARMIDMARRMA